MVSHLARETAKRASEDINVFMEFVLRVRQSGCHRIIQNHLETHDRAGIIAHKDIGKTTQTLGNILYNLGRNPELIGKLVCSDDNPAKERIMFLRDMIDRNKRLRMVFPELRKDKRHENWGKYSLTVQRDRFSKDASLEAHGVLTQGEGSRADFVLFDDICDIGNTIRYPGKRELVTRAVRQVWIPLLPPEGGRAAWLATPHHEDDATSHMQKSKAWEWIELSVTGDPPESPWPERWTKSALLRRLREIGSIEFDRAYRNILHSDSERIIKEVWTKHKFVTAPRGDLRLLSWDLSAGEKESDWTAMAVADVFIQEKIIRVILIDRWGGMTYNQIIQKIRWAQEEYRPDKQLFEQTGFQVIVTRGEELVGLPIVKIVPIASKEYRVRQTAVWYEQARILFKEGLTEGGIEELLKFPRVKHDDRTDALTQLILYAIDKLGKEFAPERSASGGETRVFSRSSRGQERGSVGADAVTVKSKPHFGNTYW